MIYNEHFILISSIKFQFSLDSADTNLKNVGPTNILLCTVPVCASACYVS